MPSAIDTSGIKTNIPRSGVLNSASEERDNKAAIVAQLTTAANEITALQLSVANLVIQTIPGAEGWTPQFQIAVDGERRVLHLYDWIDGEGDKPPTGYIGALGLEAVLGDGTDLRGPTGSPGDDGLEVQLQATATHLQWRYADGSWSNLIALVDIIGALDFSSQLLTADERAGLSAAELPITATNPPIGKLRFDGHGHPDLQIAVEDVAGDLEAHRVAYVHVEEVPVAIAMTSAGGKLTDDLEVVFVVPISGYVSRVQAVARVAPTGSSAAFTVLAAPTWADTPSAIADPVTIAATENVGVQATISAPTVFKNGMGVVQISADSGATAADAFVTLFITPGAVSLPRPAGKLTTVAWNFPTGEESTITHFEILRDNALVHTVSDKTVRQLELFMHWDSIYRIRSCNGTSCSDVSSGLVVVFEPGLARGMATTASSALTLSGTTYGASRATDGRTSTQWQSEDDGAQWLMADLGVVAAFTGYRILFGFNDYATDWELEVSDDGENWTTADTVTDNTGQVFVKSAMTASARYVRLAMSAGVAAWGYSIYEFEVLA